MKKYSKFHNSLNSELVLFITCISAILLAFMPYFILGENATITIHDNLDSNLVSLKVLIENGKVFSAPMAKIDQLFNGAPRVSLFGSIEFSLIFLKLFGSYYGYVLSKLTVALIAFIGMYLLIHKHFSSKDSYILIPFGVALVFALLPFWSFTMSASGLPLLLYAFLNIRKHEKSWVNWLIILFIPFCSSLILAGFFFMVFILFIFIYDSIKSKSINYQFLTGMFLLGFMYILSHYMLFYSFLVSSDYNSHRTDFGSYSFNLSQVIIKILRIFTFGQYHAVSLHTFMIIPAAIGTYYVIKTNSLLKNWFVLILSYILFTSIYYGINYWTAFSPIQTKLMDILPIRLTRFNFLHPMFWYLLLAVSLDFMARKWRFGKMLVCLILVFQMLYVLKYHELVKYRNGTSFSDFFSTEQFKQIGAFIGKPKSTYRVLSVGFHPSIALYNGFYTLDGYLNDYPLEYKKQFRKIVAKELEKDKELKQYFDEAGWRCYAWSSELGKLYNLDYPDQNKSVEVIQHLDYDFGTFKEMGGEYILSNIKINTTLTSDLQLLKVFVGKGSKGTIYLYSLTNKVKMAS